MEIKGIILPDGLSDMAVLFIRQVIDKLDEEGRLDVYDTMNLYILAGNIERYLRCEKATMEAESIVWETPAGSRNILPEMNLQRQLQTFIITQLKEMGLTLASRSRIKRDTPEEPADTLADRLANL